MKAGTIFVLSLICSLFFLKGQDISDEARRYYIRGCTAIKMAKSVDDFDSAVKEFKSVIEIAPNFPEVYDKLGDVYEKLEKCPEATDNYNKYLSFLTDKDKISETKDKIYALEFKCEKIKKKAAILGEWFAEPFTDSLQSFKFYLDSNTIMVNADTNFFHNATGGLDERAWVIRMSFPVTFEADDKINFSVPVKINHFYWNEKEDTITEESSDNFTFKLKIISDKLMVGTLKGVDNEFCLIFLRTKDLFARLNAVKSIFFKNNAIPCDGIDTSGIIRYLMLY